ncbi:NF038215 family lipoprotein [Acinetobacter guerrae]|uniref:NF038215 family lipoprotein n=1 Tax=Acinetobacter guerrae TaxID=1843371 RepID=UPI00128CA8A5|nr:NF038215 family lipoprotein [Acinetobacter guerrae]MPW45217.1 hypothetical protein [Acinetobacter guerrae]
MKRMFLYGLLMSSCFSLMGCDVKKDHVQPPKTVRSISIAGMPVYEKDFKLEPLLANDTQINQNQ